jgi:hypothetical protein
MRSLLIPLIILAWLGCGYLSLWLIAKDEKDKPFFEDGGDVFFGFCFLLAGPLALIVAAFATAKPRKNFLNLLNRIVRSKTLPILCLSAVLVGCNVQERQINACALACRDSAIKTVNWKVCECFEPAYNKGEK